MPKRGDAKSERPSEVPGPHPEPPTDLPARSLPWFDLATKLLPWYRPHSATRAPLFFGRAPDNRFNAPGGEFGVLCLAADPFGAFIETYGQTTGHNQITTTELTGRSLCRVSTSRPLALVDLTGAGLARIGADARLCTGDHALARRWSLAIWRHPASPDGLA
jgi:hypothetical protein